jgi:methionine synthase II (cobalamin-independent)
LITSKFPKLEDPEEMKQRINAAAEIIAQGVEPRTKAEAMNQWVHSSDVITAADSAAAARICISPQCGFASHSLGNEVTDEDMANKLRLVVKVAKEVWMDA